MDNTGPFWCCILFGLEVILVFEFAVLLLVRALLAQSHGQSCQPGKTAQLHRFDGRAGDDDDG